MQFLFWIGGAAATVVAAALLRRHGVDSAAKRFIAGTPFRAAAFGRRRAQAERQGSSRPQEALLQDRSPSAAAAAAREAWLRREIQHLGAEWFPDDRQCDWLIHGFEHRGSQTLVEVEPRPQTVGYPRFKFVASFAPETGSDAATDAADREAPDIIAVYCLRDGQYSLLGTAPGIKARLPAVLDASV